MSFPSFNDLSRFAAQQGDELQQFVAYLQGFLSAQHKDDGSHSAVTADSLTLNGPLTWTGVVTLPTGEPVLSTGTPTITNGFGGGATVRGTDASFYITLGTLPGNSGTITFGNPFPVRPVLVATYGNAAGGGPGAGPVVNVIPTPTTVLISYQAPLGAVTTGDTIDVLVVGLRRS